MMPTPARDNRRSRRMLTVKHIASDGVERIMEAETIEIVRGKGLGNNGFFLDREPFDGNTDQGACLPAKHFIDFVPGSSPPGVAEPMVYIMNRFGATVATYKLKDSFAPMPSLRKPARQPVPEDFSPDFARAAQAQILREQR